MPSFSFGLQLRNPVDQAYILGYASANLATGRVLEINNDTAFGANTKLWVHSNADVVPGPGTAAAVATTATGGFVYVRSCNGTPTGVPTNSGTGRVPLVYDYANHRLYAYHGSWRSVVLA